MPGYFPAFFGYLVFGAAIRMRGPRLSLSDEFRESWDKENRDPITLEYSPRTRRSKIDTALESVSCLEGKRAHSLQAGRTWIDDLLDL